MVKNKNKYILGKLFGSTTRVKLLKLFVLHPSEKYYIRQLARDLQLQLNSVRRELENLEAFGIISSRPEELEAEKELSSVEEFLTSGSDAKKAKDKKEKNPPVKVSDKKYYQADVNFVLFPEIKGLLVKAQMMYEQDFSTRILSAGNPKLVILTGFFVNDSKAQVDLLIVGKINKQKLVSEITELEQELGREVNYTVMDSREFKYRRDITDVFLYGILEGKKMIVIDEIGLG